MTDRCRSGYLNDLLSSAAQIFKKIQLICNNFHNFRNIQNNTRTQISCKCVFSLLGPPNCRNKK